MPIEDACLPSTTIFLNVLQAANAGINGTKAYYGSSTSDSAFDRTQFGTVVAFFLVNSGEAIAATTFSVGPKKVDAYYAGLKPARRTG